MIDQSKLLPMETAPRDGTPIRVRFEHENFKYALDDDDHGARWEALQEARWTDHNGGGWTWCGMMGRPTGWLPMSVPIDPADERAAAAFAEPTE